MMGLVLDLFVVQTTDSSAFNFNSFANEDNNSCVPVIEVVWLQLQ